MPKGLHMKYFVLNPAANDIYGSASRLAMLKYAEVIGPENREFAGDLIAWVEREQDEADKSYEAAMARASAEINKDGNGG